MKNINECMCDHAWTRIANQLGTKVKYEVCNILWSQSYDLVYERVVTRVGDHILDQLNEESE